MRRCPRCDVVFQLEDRTRCLYCDSLLVRGGMEKKPAGPETPRPGTAEFYVGRFFLAKTLVLKLLKERGADDHGRMQFLVGSFFKTRDVFVSCTGSAGRITKWARPIRGF